MSLLSHRLLSRCVWRGTSKLISVEGCSREEWRERDRRREQRSNRFEWKRAGRIGGSILAMSWMITLKDMLGIEKVKLDDDPLKDKIKQSWLQRKHGAYEEAVKILHEALQEARERKEEIAVTRITDELANTYYEKGDLEEAEKCFREALQRLVSLHALKDGDPIFIGISLKLADLLARRGRVDDAETGFMHCLRKQMKVVDEHLAKNSVARGAMVEDRHIVDTMGAAHSDPLALFGMCLDGYARFIVMYRDEKRLNEADEYMGEVMKISYQIYGSRTAHSVHMASNFGTLCVMRNRFELAKKYLSIAADRAVHIDECAPILPTLYCSYAEALFHCGDKEKALEWARRALSISRPSDEKTRKYVAQFVSDLERDMGRRKRFYFF